MTGAAALVGSGLDFAVSMRMEPPKNYQQVGDFGTLILWLERPDRSTAGNGLVSPAFTSFQSITFSAL